MRAAPTAQSTPRAGRMNSFDFSLVEEQDPSVGERARAGRARGPLLRAGAHGSEATRARARAGCGSGIRCGRGCEDEGTVGGAAQHGAQVRQTAAGCPRRPRGTAGKRVCAQACRRAGARVAVGVTRVLAWQRRGTACCMTARCRLRSATRPTPTTRRRRCVGCPSPAGLQAWPGLHVYARASTGAGALQAPCAAEPGHP